LIFYLCHERKARSQAKIAQSAIHKATIARARLWLVLLYKSLVRPHVEFANLIWCPFTQGDRPITEIKKIQKRATKLVIKLKNKSFRDGLFHLNLPTLKYRRLRGDMIEVFKIINNIHDATVHISSSIQYKG